MELKDVVKNIFLASTFVFISGFFIFMTLFLFSNASEQNLSLASVSDSFVGPKRNWDVVRNDVLTKSAIAVEYSAPGKDKPLFTQNIDARLPMASLTKLMSAVVVLDSYRPDFVTSVSEAANLQDLVPNDVALNNTMTVENFFNIMLVSSSNKAAYALSEIMGTNRFVDLMNKKAEEVGLKDTFFADPTGLSENNYSTASDLAKLAEYIIQKYPEISQVAHLKSINIPSIGTFENTNELIDTIPGVLISKTGFTDDAKGCLLLVVSNEKNDDYLIYVVLGADDRFATMKDLINWTNQAYTW